MLKLVFNVTLIDLKLRQDYECSSTIDLRRVAEEAAEGEIQKDDKN